MKRRLQLLLLIFGAAGLVLHSQAVSGRDDAGPEARLDLTGSRQGQAVAFVDVDGDGHDDKLVGAPFAALSSRTGAVLVYRGMATGYDPLPMLVLTGDDNFGYSLVNLGDVDGDKRDDFAVGALNGSDAEGAEPSLSGTVSIYKGGSKGQLIGKVAGEGPMDKFGLSLAAGDLNNDGYQDIIVGAPFHTPAPHLYQQGAVYVFTGPAFKKRTALHAAQGIAGLGWAAAAGDINGDGIADLLIAARGKVLGFYGGSTFAPSLNSPDVTISGSATGLGRKVQSPPAGHRPGKDNGPGTGTHNAGEDCGICHRPQGKAANYVFTVAGTFYEDRTARKTLAGGEVMLQDVDGKVISMTSNGAGNFWTYRPIGSNPRSLASHGGKTVPLYRHDKEGAFIPADPADSRTWQYKAWVRRDDRFIGMVTIAPVGGSTDPASRISCNMHHAAMGSRGGLWVSAKSTLPSYPAAGLSFKKHVLPVLKNKCVPCHIPGDTLTRLVTESDVLSPATSLDYSSGLDLTSYSGSTVKGITKSGARDLAEPYQSDPEASPLLAMPAAPAVHPAGHVWHKTDADYRAIRQWIAEGARNN